MYCLLCCRAVGVCKEEVMVILLARCFFGCWFGCVVLERRLGIGMGVVYSYGKGVSSSREFDDVFERRVCKAVSLKVCL